MQPEPLLYLGMTNGDLGRPLNYGGVYAAGNPILGHDRSGNVVETLWDIANVGMDVWSLGSNVAAGNWAGAAMDAGGLLVDAAATVVPGVPGGAGAALKAARAADAGVDALQAMKRVDNAVDSARAADNVADAAKAGGGFIVHPSGTAVHKSQAEMVDSITGAGATKVGPTAKGDGTIYNMDTPGGPMEVRVMDGTPGGGPNSGPRTVTTRDGTQNAAGMGGERVQANGDAFPSGTSKADRQAGGHTHEQVNDR